MGCVVSECIVEVGVGLRIFETGEGEERLSGGLRVFDEFGGNVVGGCDYGIGVVDCKFVDRYVVDVAADY